MPVTTTATTPRARALAAALREAREASGVGQREAARRLDISHAAVSHWETGKRVPRVEDVAGLLVAIGVNGDDRERILDLARHAEEPDWLTVGIPGTAQQLAGVMECERTATAITDWSPWMIPGLLQTSAYARAVLSAGNAARSNVEARVLVRLGRRDVLNRSDLDSLRIIIGEPAIRQVIGCEQVMIEQLRQVIKVAEDVSVRIVPIGRDWHPGLMGPFVLYQFAGAPAIVHIEHHRSSAFVYEEDDVAAYVQAATTVQEVAMSPDESIGLIADVITGMETTK